MYRTGEHRFQNALDHVLDCRAHLNDVLSDEESLARQRFINVCEEIVAFAQRTSAKKHQLGIGLDRGEPKNGRQAVDG